MELSQTDQTNESSHLLVRNQLKDSKWRERPLQVGALAREERESNVSNLKKKVKGKF